MKKYEKYIYVAIAIILVGVILSGTTYIILKDNKTEINEDNKPNKNYPVVKTDGVELKKVYELNDKIVEEYEIALNGIKKTAKVVFEYKLNSEWEEIYSISGTLNGEKIYYEEFWIDSKKENFNLNSIKENFNEQNFTTLEGTDNKSYLLVKDIEEVESYLHVFNDNLEIISNNIREDELLGKTGFNITYFYNNICGLEGNVNPWYSDKFGVKNDDTHIHIKIENNKTYFLCPIYTNSNGTIPDILEEREYTINNNKLEYKVLKTYKITNVCNQV